MCKKGVKEQYTIDFITDEQFDIMFLTCSQSAKGQLTKVL